MSVTKRKPTDLSRKAWKRVLLETKAAIGNKDISALAAGVAYFGTLAFFPTLAAFVSIYALFVTPHQILALGESAKHVMPGGMADLITRQLLPLASDSKKSLIGGVVAIVLAIYSASSGVENLIKALNRTFDVEETRGTIKLKLVSLVFMLGFIVAAFPVIGLILVRPDYLRHLGVAAVAASVIGVLRWVLLAIIITFVLAAVFRYAPDRRQARWAIVTWGGAAATVIWMAGTALFFVYVQYFASFNQTYGVFAGIIILMSWLNLSAFIILIGAEVNHRLEEATEPVRRLGKLNPRRLFGAR